MALVAVDLKDEIKSVLLDKDSATEALSALGDTIATYIIGNAEIAFVWSAALPSPPNTPDPVTTATGEFISLSFSLTPSLATNQTTAINFLKTELIVGLTASTYNITEAGFATSAGLMSTSPSLSSLNISISGSDQDIALTQLATNIIDWVKLQIPVGPCSGTHGVYTGAGLVTSIA